jgi:beta-glucosidase
LIARLQVPVWDPSAPLHAIRDHARNARVVFDPGVDPAAAAAAARLAQVAVVFVYQHLMEGEDAASLDLPANQNALVAAVAAANPRTIVVLETGGPVRMPWEHAVAGVLEAWYPGIRGGQVIANLLFGTVTPSGKLAVTFPRSESQLPRSTTIIPSGFAPDNFSPDWRKPFDVRYSEGIAVGYKWFDQKHEEPLFPFGYGLSYAQFAYSALRASVKDRGLDVEFTVSNTSRRSGAEIAEIYLTFPRGAGEPPKRLIGWARIDLEAGQSRRVELHVQSLYLSIFDTQANQWREYPGRYTVRVGPSSAALPLSAALSLR